MKKRMISLSALLMTAAMTFSLTACGKTEGVDQGMVSDENVGNATSESAQASGVSGGEENAGTE